VSSNRQLDSLLRPLCKAAGSVHLSVHHSTYPDYTRFVRLLERLTLHLSDEAVAVSQAVADSYRPLGRSLDVILHGVRKPPPHKAHGAIRQALGLSEAERVFLCVGRLNGIHKNQEQLVRGFRLYADAGGSGVLILLGPGPEQARLEMLIRELRLTRRVFLIPGDPDVGSYLQDATIYVQPSTYEGFGLTLVEAMSHALPVVATRLPAFEEILRDCPVFWIDGFEAAAIASALSRAAAVAPAQREDMGRAVHARYRKAFSVATMVDQYETLFERLLAA
jgi:glycosyltransferase involved in cell wall biosynthesis